MSDTLSSGRTSTTVTPDMWAVYVLKETWDSDGKKTVLVWITDVVGSFSDCSRDKRLVILPADKAYRSVMVRHGNPVVSEWGYSTYQGRWVNPTF